MVSGSSDVVHSGAARLGKGSRSQHVTMTMATRAIRLPSLRGVGSISSEGERQPTSQVMHSLGQLVATRDIAKKGHFQWKAKQDRSITGLH